MLPTPELRTKLFEIKSEKIDWAIKILVDTINVPMHFKLIGIIGCLKKIGDAQAYANQIKNYPDYQSLNEAIKSLGLFLNFETISFDKTRKILEESKIFYENVLLLFNDNLTELLKKQLQSVAENEIWFLKTSSHGEGECDILNICK